MPGDLQRWNDDCLVEREPSPHGILPSERRRRCDPLKDPCLSGREKAEVAGLLRPAEQGE